MKKLVKVFLTCWVVLIFSACTFMTRDDIQKQDEDKQLKDQISSMQKNRADSDEKYSGLESDMRTVAGRVDTLDHNQQVVQQQMAKDMEALKKLVAAQNDKIAAMEQHIDATETRLTAAIQALANNPPQASAKSDSAAAAGGSGASSGKKSTLWDDAESLFSKKDFKQAILKYQSYKDKNPKGPKSAEATYKMGLCFAELGRKKEAKEFYQATIDTYPGTPSAKKAKFRLAQSK